MSKYFIVNADHIEYNPKDAHGVKDKSITKHAIVLHMIKKTLTGFTTAEQFVAADYEFYQCLANVLGTDIKNYSYCGVDIEYDARGNVADFTFTKRYDSITDLGDFFGIPPKSDTK